MEFPVCSVCFADVGFVASGFGFGVRCVLCFWGRFPVRLFCSVGDRWWWLGCECVAGCF